MNKISSNTNANPNFMKYKYPKNMKKVILLSLFFTFYITVFAQKPVIADVKFKESANQTKVNGMIQVEIQQGDGPFECFLYKNDKIFKKEIIEKNNEVKYYENLDEGKYYIIIKSLNENYKDEFIDNAFFVSKVKTFKQKSNK